MRAEERRFILAGLLFQQGKNIITAMCRVLHCTVHTCFFPLQQRSGIDEHGNILSFYVIL